MAETITLEPNEVRYEAVIGCDVHRDTVVTFGLQRQPDGTWLQTKEVFPTTPTGLQSFVSWCAERNPQQITMESTGVYWMPPYDALELAGLPIAIVNPAHVKRMDGRKTDMEDAHWLAKITVNGAFTPSYIPTLEYRHLRLAERNVTKMIGDLTSYKNRETKAFMTAGFNLSIFSDQYGKSAMLAKEAILAGKSPEEIADLVKANATSRLKATREQMIEAFNGHLTDEVKMTIKTLRNIYSVLEKQIEEEKERLIQKISGIDNLNFTLLQTIPGISRWAATIILIEIGGAANFLANFANADRFASWTGLCPGNNQSASKRTGSKRRHGNKSLRRILCEAAHSAVRTKDTTFRSKYQGLVIRLGTKRSIVAIAHKILNMVFYVLSHKKAYVDPHKDYQAASCEKNSQRWIKQLMLSKEYDMTVTNLTTGEVMTSEEFKRTFKQHARIAVKEAGMQQAE